MKNFYLNKQMVGRAKTLGYPIDIISKKKPKNSIRLNSTEGFIRYAYGSNNYLVPKKGYKLIYK